MKRPASSSDAAWLPDFCRLPTLFTSLAATQIAVFVIWLAPAELPPWSGWRLLATSTFAQWLALCSVVAVCRVRRPLSHVPRHLGALLAWCIPVSVAWVGSLMAHELDASLGSGLALPLSLRWRFAGNNALIAGLLAAALMRYFYVQEQWAAQERAQIRAQVDALQARIRPHFLFNSMNIIASLVRRDPATAERVVENLSDLFRAALGGGQPMQPLAAELELCQQYLDIEKLRFAERLDAHTEIAADVPLDLPLPRLLLQPLVENAIHHGIARMPQGGRVSIRVWMQGGMLHFEVTNPFPVEAFPPQPELHGNQHAQDSIDKRLAYHFGARARMVRTREDGYYVCRLSLPIDNP